MTSLRRLLFHCESGPRTRLRRHLLHGESLYRLRIRLLCLRLRGECLPMHFRRLLLRHGESRLRKRVRRHLLLLLIPLLLIFLIESECHPRKCRRFC